MKKIIFSFIGLAAITMSFIADDKKGSSSIDIGTTAPEADYKMKDISGESLSLNDIKKDNGLLVIFSCNTCPFVIGGKGLGEGWEGRYNEVKAHCDKHDIGMVLVNSNEAKRDGDDSYEKMKEHAKAEGYTSYYVVDKNSKLANAFGAKTTPHVFLFDADMKLVYKGAIDDNNSSAKEVKEHWLKDAVSKVTAGEKVDPKKTRNKGCSIKRVKK